MRIKVAYLFAVAMSLGVPQVASAADMPVKAPAFVAPVAVPFNWTGLYLGGYVGGLWGNRDGTVTDRGNGTIAYNPPLNHTWNNGPGSGFMTGLTLGYNWQNPGSPLVLGIEGEFGYLRARGTTADPLSPANDTSATATIGNWDGIIAGRLGYAWDRALLYAKGGVAFVNLKASADDTCTTGGCGGGTMAATGSKTATGWALGAGLEYAVSNPWTIKAEYLYLGIDSTVSACGTGGGTAAGFTGCWDQQIRGAHTFKVGLNYLFR